MSTQLCPPIHPSILPVITQAACLAKCNGANVTLHRSGTFSLDEFRQAVIDTCSSGEEHLVVSQVLLGSCWCMCVSVVLVSAWLSCLQ